MHPMWRGVVSQSINNNTIANAEWNPNYSQGNIGDRADRVCLLCHVCHSIIICIVADGVQR